MCKDADVTQAVSLVGIGAGGSGVDGTNNIRRSAQRLRALIKLRATAPADVEHLG